jgi:polyribonucleotide nucleotidyltransferase
MLTITIPVDKISEVFGKRVRLFKKSAPSAQLQIDVEEDGKIFISAIDIEDARACPPHG